MEANRRKLPQDPAHSSPAPAPTKKKSRRPRCGLCHLKLPLTAAAGACRCGAIVCSGCAEVHAAACRDRSGSAAPVVGGAPKREGGGLAPPKVAKI